MVNHYLRRHGTDSMQKKRRQRRWLLTLFVLFCSMSPWQGVQAYTDWNYKWNSFKWNVEKGCIEYSVRYFQTWGGGNVDGYCGFAADENPAGAEIVQYVYTNHNYSYPYSGNLYNLNWDDGNAHTTRFRIQCQNHDGSLNFLTGVDQYTPRKSNDDEYEAWVEWNQPVQQRDLNHYFSIQMKGVWWKEGAAGDDRIDERWRDGLYLEVTPAKYKEVTPKYSYTTQNGSNRPIVQMNWERDMSGNAAKYGDIYLYEGGSKTSWDGEKYISNPSGKKGVLYVNATADFLKTSHTFNVHQEYTPTKNSSVKYEANSPNFVVEAYPQVSSFNVSADTIKKIMNITWQIPTAPDKDCNMSPFVLYIKKTSKDSVSEKELDIDYVPGKLSYEYSFDLADGEVAEYNFSIERKATRGMIGWTNFKKEYTIKVSTDHWYPKNIVANLVTTDGNPYVRITWQGEGSVWLDNSSFVIERINETTSRKEEFEVDHTETEFVDRLIQACNTYSYTIKVIPGGNYSKQSTIIRETFKDVRVGSISGFSVSKGYYSDKVNLKWEATINVDEVIVQRREYGKNNEKFQTVETVTANEGSELSFDDKSCLPGILYEYRIYGKKNCDGEDFSTKDTLYDLGFRTPTGDFYGHVTFENGQGVDSVYVRLQADDAVPTYALGFDGMGKAVIPGHNVLKNNSGATLQAWVNLTDSMIDSAVIIRKADLFELGLDNKFLYFKVGDKTLVSKEKLSVNDYTHISAVYDVYDDKIYMYVNGKLSDTLAGDSLSFSNSDGDIIVGDGFVGDIDEVRLWSLALSSSEIMRDYTRYLVGNETGLDAYYTFEFMMGSQKEGDQTTNGQIFDCSYEGTSSYHGNTGTLYGVKKTRSLLNINQLSYCGISDSSGVYNIRAVPYYGNGTAYTLMPVKGSHQFSPRQEIRFIAEGAQHHTVNFTDKSSFLVDGLVLYSGGNYPVEGVSFTIDGSPAINKRGDLIMTNASGEFSINVPVGIHEVKAVKNGHTFDLDGRICNSDGTDRNYQDIVSNLRLYDNTKVKYVGRVCGGTIQESYPVGHSLSKNNLANGITVKLTHTRPVYAMQDSVTVIEKHYVANHDTIKKIAPHVNEVEYKKDGVLIHVNDTTGEFVAYVAPEMYKVEVSANGHIDINGSGSMLDLSSVVNVKDSTVYTYRDSIGGESIMFSDTVRFNKSQIFVKRYKPTLIVAQCDRDGQTSPYFGEKKIESTNVLGDKVELAIYDTETGSYYFGSPVYKKGITYYMLGYVNEEYIHTNTGEVDAVPVKNGKFDFTVNFSAGEKSIHAEADTSGKVIVGFMVGEPELTTATSTISAKVICGDDDNPTSIAWICPFAIGESNKVYVKGDHVKGTNFVTAGPDKLLTVLRDPPGSNSYSFLEKGVSFTESSTATGTFHNEGFEGANITSGTSLKIFQGTAGGGALVATENTSDFTTTLKVGVAHEETLEGSDQFKNSFTLTNRYQTSDDPLYVGADGDVYIGYSTNMFFGESEDVTLIKKATYNAAPEKYEVVYTDTTGKDYLMVKSSSISVTQSFNTLFAYPQIYIEQTLIPNLESLINKFLIVDGFKDVESYKRLAEETHQSYYLSYLPADHPDFGKANTDMTIADQTLGNPKDVFDGPSYMVISPKDDDDKTPVSSTARDTINILNQWIVAWKDRLAQNEMEKAYYTDKYEDGNKISNFSFHAGSPIEYTEEYSTGRSHTNSFNVSLGIHAERETDVEVGTSGERYGSTFTFEETATTAMGGSFETEVERNHSKGFVLSEDGDDDYISVDVYHERGWSSDWEKYEVGQDIDIDVDTSVVKDKDYYSSFVFITRGGATSCPYEKAYVTKYYQPGTEIGASTMQLEVPSIGIENDFVENVPSGEEAFFTLYLRNNSETSEDQWFDLRLIDASNPDGAIPSIDGNSMSGFALDYLVPAGETLVKTMSVTKGKTLNYDNLQLVLASKCQADPTSFLDVIADTVSFSVHFIPSCTDVAIVKPYNNWTYNTNCPVDTIDGLVKHYMPITISDFDVNYADFEHIELQYKPASSSDNDWITLAYYYKEDSLTQKAVANGFNAFSISSEDAGSIYYKFYMDENPDQYYDLRAVSYCNINNELYDNPSEVVSGIKDMYNPRLFGSPRPANGVLTIDDDIRIDFNETIADGKLTVNNFEITGVRNGVASDHSVAIALDGENDYLVTDVSRNFANKDLTFECWVNFDSLQNATFFSHGDASKSISMGMNKEGKIVVKVGGKEIVSENAPAWEKSSWNHVALVYDNENRTATAYVNYTAAINAAAVGAYDGAGIVEVGRNVANQSGNFNGKVDQFRIWNAVRSSATIQANSTTQLSGNDLNLIAYYEMEEAKGSATEDKARGANLIMKGGTWALPEGRSAEFDGASYVAMNSSSAVITSDMDFTLEFWFNAKPGATNQTLISNGTGLASNAEDASKLLRIGFDQPNVLTFCHNGYVTPVDGNFADNNWHNFTLAVNRSSGVARIYMDGELNTYFSADKIGGVASDKLFAAARVYYALNDSTSEKVRKADQKFTGMIDEVRLWNLYRQQSQVENFYNQKSNGDEMGLLLYYPFEHYVEWQGTPEMQFTLEDKGNDAVDGDGKKIAFANASGNVSASVNIPPVKNKGAVSKLLYDWVVNNDALIINLTEQDYRIEKTIVNFTVKEVQDMNGNLILSPITWSAYIDRNQLKWMDDAVTVNKKQNEPYKFEMPIVNKGGSVINYSMKNMPSWLSASPESGAINPLEKQTIEFEIDPSLAVGTYDEVVYLTNSNNVTEPLSLNVTVEGDTPEWSVDPSKYEFSMAVFAQIKLDNQFSNDEKDMLAAFYNGECVGVANMSYDKTMDMWYAMMTVYSNSNSHDLVYRAWDASKGVMMAAVSSPVVPFKADTVYGKPTAPVVFYNGTTKYQNIPLSKGWNWVSFNLENKAGMSDLTAYLNGGRWGSNSIVKDLSGHSANYSVDSRKWSNDSLVLNNTSMFKIYSDENQVLSVSGKDINLDSMLIPVKAGSWNYIAYLPAGSMTLKAALAGYEAKEGDIIKSNEGFAMYYGNEWIGSLNSLQPNCGYMLKNTGDVQKTFKYPSSSSALRSAVSVASSAYESNMSIIASAPEKREGDVLRALVGTAENKIVEVSLSDDRALQFINVSAKSGDKVRFTMERDGVVYEANNALSFTGDAVYGTPDNPFVLNFNVGGVETLTVYPNPVVDELNVAGKLDGEGDVTLELFDVVGAILYEKQVSASDNVLDESVNVTGLVPGSYMLKVTQGDESKVFKVVKK